MNWNDLAPWGHEEGSMVSIFRFRISNQPVILFLRVLRIVFVQNRRLSIFSVVTKFTWPEVTDVKIPRYAFRYCYSYQSLTVSRRSCAWTCAEKMHEQVCQKWRSSVPPFLFFKHLRKDGVCVSKHSPSTCHGSPGPSCCGGLTHHGLILQGHIMWSLGESFSNHMAMQHGLCYFDSYSALQRQKMLWYVSSNLPLSKIFQIILLVLKIYSIYIRYISGGNPVYKL